jgi:hypothetical protein
MNAKFSARIHKPDAKATACLVYQIANDSRKTPHTGTNHFRYHHFLQANAVTRRCGNTDTVIYVFLVQILKVLSNCANCSASGPFLVEPTRVNQLQRLDAT